MEPYQDLVLDQGEEGACTGYGLSAVINYILFRDRVRELLAGPGLTAAKFKARLKEIAPSPKDHLSSPAMLYYLARVYDEWEGEDYEGSSCRGALKGWHKHGVCKRRFWPAPTDADFDKSRNRRSRGYFSPPSESWRIDAPEIPLGAYYRIDVGCLADMQAAIHEVGAIYVSADVHKGWSVKQCETLDEAVIPYNPELKTAGSHAFAIVGYTDKGFLVQNSWGLEWGVLGFGVLTYADWLANGTDAWAVGLGVIVGGAAVTGGKRRAAASSSAVKLGDGKGLTTSFFGVSKKKAVAGPDGQIWSPDTEEGLERCHSYAIVMDRGLPLERLVIPSGRTTVEHLGHFLPSVWLRKQANPKVVVFAHGGLNQEKDGIARVAKMAPWFLVNGIYPLFLVWKTGPWETIGNLIGDEVQSWKDKFGGPAGGFLDHLRDRFRSVWETIGDRRDYAIEEAADRLLVRAVWNDMKASARNAARQGGATSELAAALKALAAGVPGLEIHCIGHSAGSIILGDMLPCLEANGLGLSSCHLYAAACTIPFAEARFGAALDSGLLPKSALYQSVLTDELERDDTCFGVYGKSLLYLVSRGLETPHKMPLLGLAAAVDQASATAAKKKEKEVWATDPEIHAALTKWNARKLPVTKESTEQARTAASPVQSIARSHGSFDNDIDLVNRTLKVIAGKTLARPVDDLIY